MGDRANIVVESAEGRIFLYTHWGGYGLAERLAIGLNQGKGRWSDPSYLTRILAREMGMGEQGETGFGISISPQDNEHPYLVVDTVRQTVRMEDADSGSIVAGPWAFRDYADGAGQIDWTSY